MITRRTAVKLTAGALAVPGLARAAGAAEQNRVITRAIPSSGELIPVMGMGTSRTFDTSAEPASLATLGAVMQAFLEGGGAVIDSSPMYGRAESRVGDVLQAMQPRPPVFAATKVWTTGKNEGIAQMEESARRMNVDVFDLIAVHNLKDWKVHLDTLRGWKAEGRVRYIGITTSHGRSHSEFLEVMRSETLDFVQFSYNMEDRVAETELLPLAQSRGIATMINRPFQRGALFKKARDHVLPDVAKELDCGSWGQFFLKFILAHPAVTNIIPATSKMHHMQDNMQANRGLVPDKKQRQAMLTAFEAL